MKFERKFLKGPPLAPPCFEKLSPPCWKKIGSPPLGFWSLPTYDGDDLMQKPYDGIGERASFKKECSPPAAREETWFGIKWKRRVVRKFPHVTGQQWHIHQDPFPFFKMKKLPFTRNVPQTKNSLFSSRCLKKPKTSIQYAHFCKSTQFDPEKTAKHRRMTLEAFWLKKKAKEVKCLPEQKSMFVSLPYLSNCKSLSDNLNPFVPSIPRENK